VVTGVWRKSHEELDKLYSSPDIKMTNEGGWDRQGM